MVMVLKPIHSEEEPGEHVKKKCRFPDPHSDSGGHILTISCDASEAGGLHIAL